jgi:P4 family phage/plasmid primase-like protien
MSITLNKFLKSNASEGSYFNTHVNMIPPKMALSFNRDHLEQFWSMYCDAVSDTDNKIPLGIAEKSQNTIPVIVDIDIKLKDTSDLKYDDHLYSEHQLKLIVNIYQTVLSKIIKDCKDDVLMCVVLEKPIYSIVKHDIKYIKNGFHFHFPKCFIRKIDYDVHLLPRIISIVKEKKVFESLGIFNVEQIIDKAIISAPWLMYGSVKEIGMHSYSISKIFNHEMKELSLEQAFGDYTIFDSDEKQISFCDQDDNIDISKIKYFLPRILSINIYNRDEYMREIKSSIPLLKNIDKQLLPKESKYNEDSVDKNIEIAKELINMLSDERAFNRNEWIEIGWIIYNISDGCDEGFQIWCDFSSRDSDKYDQATCLAYWNKMTRKKYTIGTLKYYAKLDNPSEYNKYIYKQISPQIDDTLNGSHADLARLLYTMYSDEFVCASISNRTWFQFVNHKWELIDEGFTLRKKLSDPDDPNSILSKYNQLYKDVVDVFSKTEKKDEISHNTKLKSINKMISNLKTHTFKNNVMKEAVDLFYDKSFKDLLNTNPYIIGMKNGVYDLKNNIFRDGKPEDYISNVMSISYKDFNEDDNEVHEVYDFLEKVFPDKSLRNYFMDTTSDVFVGGNPQKLVLFLLGSGNNAKSVTQTIIEKMLGPLAIKFNTTLLTGKKSQSGSANAELARAGNGVRWAVLEEPDGNEELNIGMLKLLSGNDSVFVRDLFEKGKETKEMVPLFKLIFICNRLPKLRFYDSATWNRIRVIPFESTFSEDAPSDPDEQLRTKTFPIDKHFSKKIPHLLQAFCWVLLEHRKKMNGMRVEPHKVKAATALYRQQNDLYQQFINEYISVDPSSSITDTELYSVFKSWYKFSNNGLPPNQNDVNEYFENRWGVMTRKKWIGFKIKSNSPDESKN